MAYASAYLRPKPVAQPSPRLRWEQTEQRGFLKGSSSNALAWSEDDTRAALGNGGRCLAAVPSPAREPGPWEEWALGSKTLKSRAPRASPHAAGSKPQGALLPLQPSAGKARNEK